MKLQYHQLRKEDKIVAQQAYNGFSDKEIVWILIATIIAAFISFLPILPTDPLTILARILIFAGIIFLSCTVKKRIAKKHALRIEHTVWKFSRYWYYESSYLKKPFPIGLLLPFCMGFFSLGYIQPFTFLQFESENISSIRLLKARGYKRALRKEFIHEADLANTAAAGFYALTILALLGYVLLKANIPLGFDLAKFAFAYNLWNLVPISNLDGTKLFFGSTIQWTLILILNGTGLALLFL